MGVGHSHATQGEHLVSHNVTHSVTLLIDAVSFHAPANRTGAPLHSARNRGGHIPSSQISAALRQTAIAKHDAQNEILLRGKFVELPVSETGNNINTILLPEKQVYLPIAHWPDDVWDACPLPVLPPPTPSMTWEECTKPDSSALFCTRRYGG